MNDQQRSNSLSGARVLVVEDEYYLADDLARTLTKAGAEVVGPVATVVDAEAKVSEGGFNCAIIDMNLRGDFSFAIAERLGETGVPFIVATGYNRTSLPDSLKHVPRVEKPFSPTEVVRLLSDIRERIT